MFLLWEHQKSCLGFVYFSHFTPFLVVVWRVSHHFHSKPRQATILSITHITLQRKIDFYTLFKFSLDTFFFPTISINLDKFICLWNMVFSVFFLALFYGQFFLILNIPRDMLALKYSTCPNYGYFLVLIELICFEILKF